MLTYLATPYSHSNPQVRHQRFERVNQIAARLMQSGLMIFSPISHTHPIAMAGDLPLGFDYWEKYDRAILSKCSGLIVLMAEGWRESIGVQAEIRIATELGLEISYIEG